MAATHGASSSKMEIAPTRPYRSRTTTTSRASTPGVADEIERASTDDSAVPQLSRTLEIAGEGYREVMASTPRRNT
jgi:hypothetical protein